MRRGLFVGRFQPPHLGHIHAIRSALEDCDELIIVIGSAQYSHTLENPFTAGERIEMIREALAEEKIDLKRILLIPVPDVGEHSIWVSRVRSFCPSFDVVYTNNPLVKRLFQEEGFEVKPINLYHRDLEMGTKIRERILRGDEWESLVPKCVARYIREIGGVERIREIAQRD
ncbi:MAG: nicotinamide-nucleotide adenylyltransferase [Thaumarchaeota archaeon]|nr:MAG: nicotinamide-nucleotide adenylyltransferase [Nitrososphaerota archaeon]HDD42843.1 nicotinamide-nucleotide adenylyltransferase [Nitrososphaeria archaeon]